jgi:hypothetical protein
LSKATAPEKFNQFGNLLDSTDMVLGVGWGSNKKTHFSCVDDGKSYSRNS